MKKFLPFLIVISLITISLTRYPFGGVTDVWWHRWFLLMVFCNIVISYKLYRHYSLVIASVFFYAVHG